jgi:hypothetical protein
MSSPVRAEILAYIDRHQKLMDIGCLYREFKWAWMDEFEDIERVRIEWDCVYNERIYGDDDSSTKMVINDFLDALETFLKK